MATPRKRGGDPAMEKLMAEALALEKARTAEQAGLLQMDKEEERRERELQMEARRRYEMDQQRKRHEEEEDRYHELMDQAHEKQLKTTARLKARQKEQAAAVKEKRDKYQAKMDAIAKARSDKLEAEMKKAKDIEQKSSTPRRGQSPRRLGTPGSGRRPGTSPRGTSPRRRVDLGASTDSLASTQRLEMMATRRLEEEKQALMKRAQPKPALLLSCSSSLRSELTVVVFRAPAGIAREKERIERIQQEKQARKAKAQQRRARLSTAGRPDTAAGDDTSLNSLGMANAGDEAEVEAEGSKARTSRNTPPPFLLCCLSRET